MTTELVLGSNFHVQEPHRARYLRFLKTRPSRETRKEPGYAIHHVTPKCFGGTNLPENLIKLTLREHYIAHLILWKGCGGKMAYAFRMMSHIGMKGTSGAALTSKQFEALKLGTRCSDETKEKLRKSRLGIKQSEDHIRNSAKARTGIKHPNNHYQPSEEIKEKIRKAHIGMKASNETKAKLSLARTGKQHSEETKEKMSKVHCKLVYCLETNTTYESLSEAALRTNLSLSSVSKSCRENKSTKGLHFKLTKSDKVP